jgi:hypothetical protein
LELASKQIATSFGISQFLLDSSSTSNRLSTTVKVMFNITANPVITLGFLLFGSRVIGLASKNCIGHMLDGHLILHF